jgi:predicted ATPase
VKLKSLQVKNYKGFKDSGIVEFSPGFNVIVGQNNSGKTALIEAVKLHRAGNQPYREKGKSEDFEIDQESKFLSEQRLRRADLIKATLKCGAIYVPQETAISSYVHQLNKSDIWDFAIGETGNGTAIHINNSLVHWGNLSNLGHLIHYKRQEGMFEAQGITNANARQYWEIFRTIELDTIFSLSSQRFNIARHNSAGVHDLAPDAQNLPLALHSFQGNQPQKFRKLIENLTEIFPTIGNITIPPVPNSSEVEIMIWPEGHSDNAKEASPLDKCGTGISQALAIIFIAAQEDEKIIVIDEISSFLHPMAIKNLIRILKQQYSRHQYIISTHYTDVIAWAEPDKVILTQKVDNECRARNISIEDVADFELLTGELGISMADVFGSDRIVWVEGDTEEQCFPLLFSHLGHPLPKGTNVAKIIATGNLSLKNRNVDMIFDIYDKVSKMASPLTRACVFTMDRETMSDQDIKTLKDKAKGNLLILNRRCYENYLLQLSAIAKLLNDLGETVTEAEIKAWLLDHGGDEVYGAQRQWSDDLANEAWLTKVDGAKLLNDMFSELSETRHTYRKTTHSPGLTQILLNENPDRIDELLAFAGSIVELIDRQQRKQ